VISEIISPVISEISSPETVPSTTAYYFPGTDAPRFDHILTIPIEMAHHTNTTSVHTGFTAVSFTPIITPRTPSVTPTLPLEYHALNYSIPTPTQTPSDSPGGPSSFGHSHPVLFRHSLNFLLEDLSRPPLAVLILVALFRHLHQVTRFPSVDNFTKVV
jgi:hypothetical protein